MARPRRFDPPGSWHHVWDRGLAKRPVFEDRRDIRRFLAALARAVRRGDLEVHSFAFVTTHLHLLVRSPAGRLSTALKRILSDFTRYFNRRRHRDGTVWRGRFCSKPVPSVRYRRILVRYIDLNPVKAGLAAVPWRYEHGSAQRFVFRTPRWLSRSWIDEEILLRTGKRREEGGRYEDAFPLASESTAALVDARTGSCAKGPDPLEDLLSAAPAFVLRWLESRARLADASKPGHPVVDPLTIFELLATLDRERPGWRVHPSRRAVPAGKIVRTALLRDLSGQTFASISRGLHASPTHCKSLYADHAKLLAADSDYAQTFLDLTLRGLAAVRDDSGGSCLTPK